MKKTPNDNDIQRLDYSSPGSFSCRTKKPFFFKTPENIYPAGIRGYIVAEWKDPSNKVFYLIRPLSSQYECFVIAPSDVDIELEHTADMPLLKTLQ